MKILHELEVSCQNSLSSKSKTSLISFDAVTVITECGYRHYHLNLQSSANWTFSIFNEFIEWSRNKKTSNFVPGWSPVWIMHCSYKVYR